LDHIAKRYVKNRVFSENSGEVQKRGVCGGEVSMLSGYKSINKLSAFKPLKNVYILPYSGECENKYLNQRIFI